MAKRPELSATPRTIERKATLNALRREGKVPAVLYGHGDPAPVALDQREITDFLRFHTTSGLIDLTLNGDRATAMIKQVDRHPVNGSVTHLDLQRVSLSDTVTTHVTVAI